MGNGLSMTQHCMMGTLRQPEDSGVILQFAQALVGRVPEVAIRFCRKFSLAAPMPGMVIRHWQVSFIRAWRTMSFVIAADRPAEMLDKNAVQAPNPMAKGEQCKKTSDIDIGRRK